jgi:hypothetical protein
MTLEADMNVIEVVDVPLGASEDEARALLNKPCEVNRYMLVQVLPLPTGFRAFYRLVSSAYDKKPGDRNALAHSDRDGKQDAALGIIRRNPTASIRQLVRLLSDAGIERRKTWVADRRIEQRGTVRSAE